jgi:two-component system, cell cycle response regulator DivK
VTLMRQIPELQNTPIIALTAWPAATALQMAQSYGCDGYIAKPIDVKNFPNLIAQYLEETD